MYNRCMICLFPIGLQGLLSPESPVGPEDDRGERMLGPPSPVTIPGFSPLSFP